MPPAPPVPVLAPLLPVVPLLADDSATLDATNAPPPDVDEAATELRSLPAAQLDPEAAPAPSASERTAARWRRGEPGERRVDTRRESTTARGRGAATSAPDGGAGLGWCSVAAVRRSIQGRPLPVPVRTGRAALLSAACLALTARAAAQQPAEPPPDAKPAAPATTSEPAPPAPPAPSDASSPPPPAPPAPSPLPDVPPLSPSKGAFSFGSYGRMVAATDLHGRPGRDANIVAHGSRLDEGNYVELELRRDDYWNVTKTGTRLVATLAIESPMFQYTGTFNIQMAVRNLYLEARGFAGTNLSVWAGSRMYRGDDIYLLDYWPLDNLNTVGGGARYDFSPNTYIAAQYGISQPTTDFFIQSVSAPQPFDNPNAANVLILNRQELEGSLKASHIVRVGEKGGIKGVLYTEIHQLPHGQFQLQAGDYETLPGDLGYVIGAQIGAFSGKRDTHVNLFVRYAGGLAAYGDFTTPDQLAPDKTTNGAHELVVALGGNYETGPLGLMVGAYVRSFRNASPSLNFEDVDEGIIALRPHVFFGELGGIAVEGSYQAQERGVLPLTSGGKPGSGPLKPAEWRVGVVPFLSPAGRGDYARPQFRLIYAMTGRNQDARALYPSTDVYSLRTVEYFLGLGAEWWFNSSSYGN
jgi:maltoporin